ncbi:hypothetical protein TNCV_3537071 [Trichonephila clavipes]|uniref:Uncharacterized protein n=1 Tax=Trichonephila clavipes TaxID=2585209 RepID=A0A8X7B9D9_TRICX|nr:hypothetical protein TNCV_3537071 [Trichonephila clavipes]
MRGRMLGHDGRCRNGCAHMRLYAICAQGGSRITSKPDSNRTIARETTERSDGDETMTRALERNASWNPTI